MSGVLIKDEESRLVVIFVVVCALVIKVYWSENAVHRSISEGDLEIGSTP